MKLGDFGLAVEVARIQYLKDTDVEGDSVYMAPELLQTEYSSNSFDDQDSIINKRSHISTKADIFSLGASLLELASGMNLP